MTIRSHSDNRYKPNKYFKKPTNKSVYDDGDNDDDKDDDDADDNNDDADDDNEDYMTIR